MEPPPGERGQPPPDFATTAGAWRRRPPGAPSIAPIVVNSTQVGHVAVPSGPPPMEVALRELGSDADLVGPGAPRDRIDDGRARDLRSGAQAAAIARARRARSDRGRPTCGPTTAAATKSAHWPGRSTAWRPSSRRGPTALAASDRARRQLLADVSHELMTPLTAIRGYTQTLAMPDLADGSADPRPLLRHRRSRDLQARGDHR